MGLKIIDAATILVAIIFIITMTLYFGFLQHKVLWSSAEGWRSPYAW